MQIQATYKRSQDSLKLLERLEHIKELDGAHLRILLNARSPEDQKLLKHLSASLRTGRPRLSPEMVKTVGFAAVFSLSFIAFGLSGLLGYW